MIRSTKTLSAGSFDPATAIDTVELDFEDRRRRRGTLTSAGGTEFHVDLAEAPTLVDGDGFELESGKVILVKGKPERLVEFRSSDPHVITRVAWHLGNRHTPTQLLENALRIRDDYVLVELVKKLGAEVGFVTAAFQPEGGAYGHGSVTGHDHHDHDHDDGHHGHKHGDHDDHGHHDHHHDHNDHGHDHKHEQAAVSEEDRLMAETIARREARRAARAEQVHVHGPNCGHDHHDHGHDHHHHDHGHKHDHDHDHSHAHGDHDHHHH